MAVTPAKGEGHLPDAAAILSEQAIAVLHQVKERKLTLATAESCTGGLLASLLTDQEGFGHCFDRAFVTYTDEAKSDLLAIDLIAIKRHGAVSAEIGKAMAKGALARSPADVALSITGFAGAAGPDDEVGLVYLTCATRDGRLTCRECHFGELTREEIRHLAVRGSLELIAEAVGASS